VRQRIRGRRLLSTVAAFVPNHGQGADNRPRERFAAGDDPRLSAALDGATT